MAGYFDWTGKRVGRLLVLERGENTTDGRVRWLCRCDCGGAALVQAHSLKSGHTQSCGCLHRERTAAAARVSSRTHGLTGTPEHRTWHSMLTRCYNPNATGYDRYGGRGITVCERWRTSFDSFLADMGERPSSEHSVDRIDPNGHYEPSNCRWATKIEQSNNRRDNRMVVIRGVEMTLPMACRAAGNVVSHGQAARRVKAGWPHEEAVSAPSRQARLA